MLNVIDFFLSSAWWGGLWESTRKLHHESVVNLQREIILLFILFEGQMSGRVTSLPEIGQEFNIIHLGVEYLQRQVYVLMFSN